MKYLFTLLFLGFTVLLSAYINPENYNKMESVISSRMDCAQATQQIDQDINNVRARLLNGGDVWWDLSDGKYIVPAVEPGSGLEEVSSIFAGAVWLGGFDPGGNLKVAAQTYRDDDETDFWPGPLDPVTGMVSQEECANWDEFFEVLGEEINIFRADFEKAEITGTELDPTTIPAGVLYWPGRGNPYFEDRYDFELPNNGQGLGAFFDRDEDGIYDPLDGDFPNIEIRGCPSGIFPDEMIFWIYNDNGGTHTNSAGSTPIQMEVQVQSFAFESNDEFNNMTFQRYKLINRATEDIDSCFFAMWVDPDLGCYNDDYIGCDVGRSLAYVYNKDELDGDGQGTECFGVPTYGANVPILGVDYFRGPLSEPRPVYDSLGELIDIRPVELGMSSFTYHNNNIGNPPAATQDPTTAEQFYRYLSGSWRDGTPFTFGGSAYNIGSQDLIDYAFVDPPNLPGGWSMCEDVQPDYDRRTIQASGPLLLEPNVVNELIIGVVWLPDQAYPCPDISQLLATDDLAQGLFDNCFKKLRGPDAPDVDIIELDKELILVLSNDTIEALSNNAFEEYAEVDFRASDEYSDEERTYRFEGYRIFQLATPASTFIANDSEIDLSKARLIADVDLKNDVTTLYNWTPSVDPTGGGEVLWSFAKQNVGNNAGVKKTFRITQDAFGSGAGLVNHTQYYFTALAYGYNEFIPFDPIAGEGQRQPFIVGDRNQNIVKGTPRPIIYKDLQSFYGDGAVVTRLDGKGIGDNFVEVTDEQRERFLDPSFDGTIEYKRGQAPIKVTVYNPLEVKNGEYLVEFRDGNMTDTTYDNAKWTLTDLGSGVAYDGQSIEILSEKLFSNLGISLELGQTACAGDNIDDANGAIGVEQEYADPNGVNWFIGIPDDAPTGNFGPPLLNFIKTGLSEEDEELDPNSSLVNMGGSGWNPYYLTDYRTSDNFLTPAHYSGAGGQAARGRSSLCNTNNVDVVFTSDKSKWSRCAVIETAVPLYYNGLNKETVGDADNFDLRRSPSVSKDDANGDGKADVDDTETIGMGWFPGYAVDVETGQRLNVFFGENSSFGPEDSLFNLNNDTITRDMMFNPNSQDFDFDFNGGAPDLSNFFLGGQHYIYVTRTKYDSCKSLLQGFNGQPALLKFRATQYITWTCMPILFPETELLSYADGLIPNDFTAKLRVSKPFAYNQGTGDNMGYNAYQFTIDGAQAREIANEQIDNALDQINVVPNPYFAYSQYEASQNRNVVRITNLPAQSKVTIYSIDGRFIRQYNRNVSGIAQSDRTDPGIPVTQEIPFQEWDIKNYAGIPVSPGVYLIHVEAPGLGERVIKWFGVNRKFNPSATQ